MSGETQIIVERLPSKEEIEARFNKNIAELWQQDRNELDQLRADNARLKGEVDLINGFREQLRSKFNRKCDTLREAMAIIESLRADNARLNAIVLDYDNREASVCPENTPFEDVIKRLRGEVLDATKTP